MSSFQQKYSGSLDVVKLPLNLWGFKNQWPTPVEVKHSTRGTILPKKCRSDITAKRPGCVLAKCPVWPQWPSLPLFFLVAGTLRVYSLPGQRVRGGGSRAISCISPLPPKQHVSLSGLVSLAPRSCCLTSAHNGILKVPCGQLWPLSISPRLPVSGCWLIRQTGGWVIVQHLPDSHPVWPTSCFIGVQAKTGLLLTENPFFLYFNLSFCRYCYWLWWPPGMISDMRSQQRPSGSDTSF